jgi:hypothetical protein
MWRNCHMDMILTGGEDTSMAEMPPPPTGVAVDGVPPVDAEPEDTAEFQTGAALADIEINKIEVLSNRLVPGSDGSIEHVVIGNNAVTVVRSTPLKGRVRVTKDNVYVGGVSCKILLTGLEARVETVRHLVGGDSPVYGALFLSKQRSAPLKSYGSVTIGSPSAVVQSLINEHCETPPSPNLKALASELNGMFLPYDKLTGNHAA